MWVPRPHSHHLHTYQMDLQQHEGTHDDLRLAGVAGGCRWSGQLDSACACPQVQVFGVCSPSHCTLLSEPMWLWGGLLPPSQPLRWFSHRPSSACSTVGDFTIHPSWGYLPITGTAVDRQQGISTHRWASMPRLWGPLLVRDPVQLSLGPQGTSYHVCHGEACTRSWQWRGYVPAEETSAPLFAPDNKGLSGGSS